MASGSQDLIYTPTYLVIYNITMQTLDLFTVCNQTEHGPTKLSCAWPGQNQAAAETPT